MRVPVSGTAEIDDIEEIEELDFLEEVEPVDEGTVTVATSGVTPRPVAVVTDDGLTRTNVVSKAPAPPPPPRTPGVGLPAIPKLSGNVLPSRPRVATAWDRLDAGDDPTLGDTPDPHAT